MKETLPHTYCPVFTNFNNTEGVWVRIDNKFSLSFFVSCVYNPNADDENYYQCILNNFENVLVKNKGIVILGDLNINYILDENLCENQAHFIETLLCCKQLIVEPTRVTQSSQSVIDHIYTTMPHSHLITGYWNILLVIITWYLQLWNLGAKLLLQKLFTKKITME